MRLEPALLNGGSASSYPSIVTTVGVAATSTTGVRIVPGDSKDSLVYQRINQRGTGTTQMPPIASLDIDTTDVATVAAWIDAMKATHHADAGADAAKKKDASRDSAPHDSTTRDASDGGGHDSGMNDTGSDDVIVLPRPDGGSGFDGPRHDSTTHDGTVSDAPRADATIADSTARDATTSDAPPADAGVDASHADAPGDTGTNAGDASDAAAG